MWAEDDFTSFSDASLQSYSEPKDWMTYVMYHGTSQDGARLIQSHGFKQSDGGMLGRWVYVSRDYNKASRYPLHYPEREKSVLKLRVDVGRVKKIDRQGHPMQKTWHHHGYDSAWVPPNCGMVKSGLEEDCIWDPDRITVTEVMNCPPCTYREETDCYHSTARFESIALLSCRMNMWAEEDSPFYVVAYLQSSAEPAQWRLYTMYHGTTKEAAENIKRDGFRQSADGMLGRGVYVSRDYNKASRYPLNHLEREKRVLKLLVNVGRVKKIDKQGHPMQKTWHDNDYDSAWVPPNCGMVKSGLEEDCIWDPNRIKVMEVMEPYNFLQNPEFSYGAHGY
ncbi:UNVERIFIED_CONTAM: hypothetical protein FKN15_001812 [Acipenser sinensis]